MKARINEGVLLFIVLLIALIIMVRDCNDEYKKGKYKPTPTPAPTSTPNPYLAKS